jgi:anti-anti-sigma factor
MSSMKISLVSIEKAGFIRLAVEGDVTSDDFLDAKGGNPFETVLGQSWASNNILLNLARSAFFDSSAIGWLIDSQRSAQSAGGKLVLHSAQPRVGELFDLLKLRSVLNLKDDEKSARQFITATPEANHDHRDQNAHA